MPAGPAVVAAAADSAAPAGLAARGPTSPAQPAAKKGFYSPREIFVFPQVCSIPPVDGW